VIEEFLRFHKIICAIKSVAEWRPTMYANYKKKRENDRIDVLPARRNFNENFQEQNNNTSRSPQIQRYRPNQKYDGGARWAALAEYMRHATGESALSQKPSYLTYEPYDSLYDEYYSSDEQDGIGWAPFSEEEWDDFIDEVITNPEHNLNNLFIYFPPNNIVPGSPLYGAKFKFFAENMNSRHPFQNPLLDREGDFINVELTSALLENTPETSLIPIPITTILEMLGNIDSTIEPRTTPYFYFNYELAHEPDRWNNYYTLQDILPERNITDFTNCYNYAFNMLLHPTTNSNFFREGLMHGALSGLFVDQIVTTNEQSVQNFMFGGTPEGVELLVRIVSADMRSIGLDFIPYESGMNTEGGYRVALAIRFFNEDEGRGDFHWYRENLADGTWSHKQGTNIPERGFGIISGSSGNRVGPEQHEEYNNLTFYNIKDATEAIGYEFIGFFLVRPIEHQISGYSD